MGKAKDSNPKGTHQLSLYGYVRVYQLMEAGVRRNAEVGVLLSVCQSGASLLCIHNGLVVETNSG